MSKNWAIVRLKRGNIVLLGHRISKTVHFQTIYPLFGSCFNMTIVITRAFSIFIPSIAPNTEYRCSDSCCCCVYEYNLKWKQINSDHFLWPFDWPTFVRLLVVFHRQFRWILMYLFMHFIILFPFESTRRKWWTWGYDCYSIECAPANVPTIT